MNSTLTVAKARSQLSQYVPNADTEFLDKIGQAQERLLYGGKYRGAMVTVAFDAASGYITLGPRYLGALATTYDRVPVLTFSQWQPYQELGWCSEDDAMLWGGGRLQDMGDGWVTTTDIDETGPVLIYSAASDNGKVVRIFGEDADTGYPVIDQFGVEGEDIVMSSPFATSTKNYASLTGVSKPLTVAAITAQCDPTNGDPTYILAQYQSWETLISWRRYYTGPAEKAVRILCQRRAIAPIAETDYLWPDSIGAYKFALKALALEDAGFESKGESQECWNLAFQILNQAEKSTRAGNVVPIPLNVWGWGSPLPFSN